MEELAHEQKKLGEMISQLLENMKKDSNSRKTIQYINDRRQRFHDYWTEFKKHHQEIAALGDQEHKYFKNNFYEQVESAFNEGLRLLDIYFERAQSTVGEASAKSGRSIINSDSTKLDDVTSKDTSELIKPGSHKDTQTVTTKNNDWTSFSQNQMGEQDMRIRKQKVKMRALNRLMEDVIQNIDHVQSKTYYEYKKKTLRDNFMSISTLHEEISILAEDFEDLYFQQEEYEQLEGRYEDVMLLIHEKEGSLDNNIPQPDLKSRLPRQSIPIFEGGYNAWTSFRDIFVQIIHNNPQLCPAEKMQYLKTHLKGEAARLISHLGISDVNYLTSWNLVSERYDNKRILLFNQLELLCSLPNLNVESVKGLKQMHDTARECLHAIKNLGIDNSSWGPIIVFQLMKKLDRETRRGYEQSLKQPREIPQIDEFLQYIETRFQSLENFGSLQKSYEPTKLQVSSSKQVMRSFHATQGQCKFCKGPHFIYNCKKFQSMENIERNKFIKQNKLCLNCMSHDKKIKCYSKQRCGVCKNLHHTLLHANQTEREHDSEKRQSISTHTVTAEQEQSRSTIGIYNIKSSRQVILATALVKARTIMGD